MPNRWIEFVKEFASKNNLTYGCAVSTPACKEEYRKKYGVGKKVSQKKEREQMGEEEVRGKKVRSAEEEERKRLVEMSRMMGEDVKPARPTDLMVQALREAGKDPSAYLEMLKKRTLVVPPAVRATPIQYKPKAITEVPPKPKRKLIIEEEEETPKENITMKIAEVAPAKRSRGRPKKYATAEEAKKAKYAQTTASKRRKKEKMKGGAVPPGDRPDRSSTNATEDVERLARMMADEDEMGDIEEEYLALMEDFRTNEESGNPGRDVILENVNAWINWTTEFLRGSQERRERFGDAVSNFYQQLIRRSNQALHVRGQGRKKKGGAVGTPYLNQGTNPRGVRGGSKKEELVKQFEKLQREVLGDRFEPVAFTNVPPPPEDLVRPVIRRPAVRRGREEEEETPEEALSRLRERQQAINQRQMGRGRKYGGVAPPPPESNRWRTFEMYLISFIDRIENELESAEYQQAERQVVARVLEEVRDTQQEIVNFLNIPSNRQYRDLAEPYFNQLGEIADYLEDAIEER